MEREKTVEMEIQQSNVQLVDGQFTPSQAAKIITSLIDQKINFHKVEGFQKWERNHRIDEEPFSKRIEELKEEMKIAKAFISQLEKEGKQVKIDGIIKMTAAE